MANIYYNGISTSSYEGILCFSDVPNILQIKEDIYGTPTVIDLTPSGGWRSAVSANSQYSLTMFGETITNVLSPSDVSNKKFYIAEDEENTVASMARALRNCGTIAANFTITIENVYSINSTVRLTSRTIGDKLYNGWIDRATIPSSYLLVELSGGTADEDDGKYLNSKIDVDVYQGDEYVTTLEKNWYGNECSFDVTPVLATMTDSSNENKGDIKKYVFGINKLAEDGEYSSIGIISGFTTNGFVANQSQKYLPLTVQPLNNNKLTDRGNILYTYSNKIPFSVLGRVGNSSGFTVVYTLYDSSMSQIYQYSSQYSTPTGEAKIVDMEYQIPNEYFGSTFYVDIAVGSASPMRFNVIKPLKAAEGWQRILWRNEYGGISYFDFTGSYSETDSIDIETYEKNVFDYYDNSTYERKKIYSNNVNKTVKLKSHLMQKNGKYIFNSLARAKKVWTVINGKTHFIIPKSIEVTEDGTYNDIYTCTFSYEYSDLS